MDEKKTEFNVIQQRLLRLIENDRKFFEMYHVSIEEIEAIVMRRTKGYLIDAIDLLYSKASGNLDVDFYDYDEESDCFNFELTRIEVGLIARLMYEIHFERDEAILRVFEVGMSPSDLTQFSPANERKTFEDMLTRIKNENEIKIAAYISSDRKTGKKKTIDYGQYEYY